MKSLFLIVPDFHELIPLVRWRRIASFLNESFWDSQFSKIEASTSQKRTQRKPKEKLNEIDNCEKSFFTKKQKYATK